MLVGEPPADHTELEPRAPATVPDGLVDSANVDSVEAPWGHPTMRPFCARTIEALAEQRKICQAPASTIGAILADLLAECGDTAFGREHALVRVRTMADWKSAIPIRSYAQLRPYIDRQLSGEANVLSRSEPYAFLKTSGTTGKPKLVPTTRHWRSNYRGPALYAQWGLYFKLLRLDSPEPGNVVDLSWERQTPQQELSGFPVYSITQRPESLGGTDWTPPWYESPWFAVDAVDGHYLERLYQRLRLQAACDVRLLVSVNPSKIVALAEALREFAPRLISDLHDGSINGKSRPGLAPDPQLARRLERRLETQEHGLLLTDVWPNLAFVVCWNSASAQLYEGWLERLLPDVMRLPFSTTGTEGIVTLPVDTHRTAGPLAVNQGLYEFVPVDDIFDDSVPAEHAETLCCNELEVGRTYRLVMSQGNGLCRCDVGDIYRVLGWVGRVPRLEFVGRNGAFSSFTGEKLTESDVFTAMSRVLPCGAADAPNFTCLPIWGTPPRYAVAIEWTSGMAAIGSDALAKRIDAALGAVNIEYADKRASGRLQPMSIVRLAAGAFAKAAQKKVSLGVASAQIKHHWLQRDASFLKLFDEMGMLADASASEASVADIGRSGRQVS
jgi:hypothetical protein